MILQILSHLALKSENIEKFIWEKKFFILFVKFSIYDACNFILIKTVGILFDKIRITKSWHCQIQNGVLETLHLIKNFKDVLVFLDLKMFSLLIPIRFPTVGTVQVTLKRVMLIRSTAHPTYCNIRPTTAVFCCTIWGLG